MNKRIMKKKFKQSKFPTRLYPFISHQEYRYMWESICENLAECTNHKAKLPQHVPYVFLRRIQKARHDQRLRDIRTCSEECWMSMMLRSFGLRHILHDSAPVGSEDLTITEGKSEPKEEPSPHAFRLRGKPVNPIIVNRYGGRRDILSWIASELLPKSDKPGHVQIIIDKARGGFLLGTAKRDH